MTITNYELRITNYFRGFAFFALVLCLSCAAALAQNPMPKPAPAREAKVPQPVEQTLPNGLRVIVVQTKNVPLVTASLKVKSGGEVDPKTLAGAADMTGELLTKGTKTRTATEIVQEIEFLGGSIESGADWDSSEVNVRVMSDKLDKALEIAADTIKNPAFSPTEISRYKKQLLDELEVNLKQPATLASYVANNVVFSQNAYGHPLAGTPESIKRIRRLDLARLHQTYYRPNNSVLIIAGDIAPATAFSLAQKHFGNWIKRAVPNLKADHVQAAPATRGDKLKVEKITVIDLPNAGQAAVSIAKSGITRNNPSYFGGIVANSVLGGGYSARLNQEIRIKRGLTYGARSDLEARRSGGLFSTRTQTKNESAAEVAEIVVNELNRLAGEAIAENELTPRKLVLIGDFSRDLETTNSLVEQIGELALNDLSLNEINSFVQNVQKVGDPAIREFVQNNFGSAANIVIVGDAKKFLPDLQRRFPGTKVDVIPAAELDLNRADLRRAKPAARGKQS